MKHLFVLALLTFTFTISKAQKTIQIPQNRVDESFYQRLPESLEKYHLKDLRTSTDSLNIRIWKRHGILSLGVSDSVQGSYVLHTVGQTSVVQQKDYPERVTRPLLDSLLAFHILELNDDPYRGIDGSFVIFEVATRKNYRVFSYWSPNAKRSEDNKTVVRILKEVNQALNVKELNTAFWQSLEPGGYSWGMRAIQVDEFLPAHVKKTDFYVQAEKRMRRELKLTDSTSHREFPVVFINHKPANIADLNNYSLSQVTKLKIHQPNSTSLSALYGARARYGVVEVETK